MDKIPLHEFVVVSSDFYHPFMLGAYSTLEQALLAQGGKPEKWVIYQLIKSNNGE